MVCKYYLSGYYLLPVASLHSSIDIKVRPALPKEGFYSDIATSQKMRESKENTLLHVITFMENYGVM